MIFSHVLYQLSYPGSAAAAAPSGPASGWKRAYGEAGQDWQGGYAFPSSSSIAGGPGKA